MKKVLFLFLILSGVLAFSCKTEDDESQRDFLTILCSGVEFPEKDVFFNVKDSWIEPENYTFTYEYQESFPSSKHLIIECIVENGRLKSKVLKYPEYTDDYADVEYEVFSELYLKEDEKLGINSIKSFFDFCQKEYESAQNNRYINKTRISMSFDDSGSYPVFFESYVNDIYAYTHIDHPNELIGFSTSGFSTIVKILDFKIN